MVDQVSQTLQCSLGRSVDPRVVHFGLHKHLLDRYGVAVVLCPEGQAWTSVPQGDSLVVGECYGVRKKRTVDLTNWSTDRVEASLAGFEAVQASTVSLTKGLL